MSMFNLHFVCLEVVIHFYCRLEL